MAREGRAIGGEGRVFLRTAGYRYRYRRRQQKDKRMIPCSIWLDFGVEASLLSSLPEGRPSVELPIWLQMDGESCLIVGATRAIDCALLIADPQYPDEICCTHCDEMTHWNYPAHDRSSSVSWGRSGTGGCAARDLSRGGRATPRSERDQPCPPALQTHYGHPSEQLAGDVSWRFPPALSPSDGFNNHRWWLKHAMTRMTP